LVNIRVAGTEELLRIYAEPSDKKKALAIAETIEKITKKIEGGER